MKNMFFLILLVFSYCWFDASICNTWKPCAIIYANGYIHPIRRCYHSIVNDYVGSWKSDCPPDFIPDLHFTADGIISSQILMTFLNFSFCNQLSDKRTADYIPVNFVGLKYMKPKAASFPFFQKRLRGTPAFMSKSKVESAVCFFHSQFIHQ